ncbi:MAG: hypothetical protein JEY91_00635 [Spirochaetaceae bacterium]|nr:hypothetical protein [Spirochaetaceae bacterium]
MHKKAFILLSVLILLSIFSCNKSERNMLEKEILFSIPLGKLADEIDYFQRDNLQFSPDNDLYMKKGFFYISNGRSGKFMKFNSYGDILTLIYNPNRNPYPAELMARDSDDSNVNRQVIPWQFNSPGSIAVTDDDIYIVDKVALNRQVKDHGVLMDRNILHFNALGEYQNFIGLEGVGGQPFPYIENIWVRNDSELIVLFRTRNREDESWFVNWYSVNGNLRYSVEIREDMIPMPEGETDLIISLDNIIPDLNRYELYLKLSYFRKDKNSSSENINIIEVFGGTLDFNVEESKWHNWSRLPEHMINADNKEIDSPYSLIGSIDNYLLFMSLGENNTYNLLIKDGNGRFVQERSLDIGAFSVINKKFYLSDQGILNGIIYTDQEAIVMWWRTDKLFLNGRIDG